FMIQPQVDMLLQYFGREVDELVRAREEYFAQTGGEVHADDRCYEQRMQAFFNWFLFDRRQKDGSTPVERFLREKGADLPSQKKGAVDPRPLLWELERMALQHERFRNVSIHAIYNFQTPFLSKRGRTPEMQQGG